MKCYLTSAYHSQSNVHDESFNQTLQRQLLKFVNSAQDNWDLYIDSILFSYRVARQDSTKHSMFVLVYGRQARLPIEFNMQPHLATGHDDKEEMDSINAENEQALEDHITAMVSIRKKALQNIQTAQRKQKAYYDAKHSINKEKYCVGALVLIKNCRKLSRKGSKLEPNWTGPYHIREVLGKGTCRLCNAKDPSKILACQYNMTRLKLYYERGATQEDTALTRDLKVTDYH